MTIISDQFEAIAYRWKQAQPAEMHKYFAGPWMKENILENHGPLCASYKAHEKGEKGFEEGDFRSEGDSPAYMHTIVTGLRNLDSPDWGGWGGRYVKVRENTWLDPVPEAGYEYPKGRWYGSNGWGRSSLRPESKVTEAQRQEYFKPMWQWTAALQNDFAARADWCVKPYAEANHPPVVVLAHRSGYESPARCENQTKCQRERPTRTETQLNYRWWQYEEADSYDGAVKIRDSEKQNASFTVPGNARKGQTIHIICEVTDNGKPALTRYQRVILNIE